MAVELFADVLREQGLCVVLIYLWVGLCEREERNADIRARWGWIPPHHTWKKTWTFVSLCVSVKGFRWTRSRRLAGLDCVSTFTCNVDMFETATGQVIIGILNQITETKLSSWTRAHVCLSSRFSMSIRYVLFLPSFTMPTLRHFWKRQYWQRLRLLLSTGQFLLARHTYLAFFCTVRWGEKKRAHQ